MSGYQKYYTAWSDFPNLTTPIVAAQMQQWENAIYELKSRVFNVKDFGAKCDGVTDDTAAVQAAANTANAGVGGRVFVPGFSRVRGVLNGYSNVSWVGPHPSMAGFVFDDYGVYGLDIEGGNFDISSNLGADVNRGDRTIQVQNSGVFTAGQDVILQDSTVLNGYSGSLTGATFITRIHSIIDATHIALEEAVPGHIYMANAGAVQACSAGFQKRGLIAGLSFSVATTPNRPTTLQALLRLRKTINWQVVDCDFDGGQIGVWGVESRGLQVLRCTFDHIYDPPGANTTSASAMYLDLCTGSLVSLNTMRRCAAALNAQRSPRTRFNFNDVGGALIQAGFPLGADTNNGGRGPKFLANSNESEAIGNLIHDIGYRGIYGADSYELNIALNRIAGILDTSVGSGDGIVLTAIDPAYGCPDSMLDGNRIYDVHGPAVTVSGSDGTTVSDTHTRHTNQGLAANGTIYLDSNHVHVQGGSYRDYGNGRPCTYVTAGHGQCTIIGGDYSNAPNAGTGWAVYTTDSNGGNKVGGFMHTGEALSIHASDLWKEIS